MTPIRRRPNPLLLLSLALVAAAALTGCGARKGALEASGTVEAVDAELGFTVPGRIESVLVQEGDTVQAGAELARLDRSETLARREQAAAQVLGAQAALRELERGARVEEVAQARAAAQAAADQLADAQRDFDRTRTLLAQALVSQQQYDKASTLLDVAKSQDRQAREALRMVEAGPRRERIDAARATHAAAQAAVHSLDATLANMVVKAPFPGIVTVRHHEPGEIVTAGAAAVTLLNRAERWVKVYIPETRLGAVHVGQGASITSDTFKGRTYRGEVMYVSSEAEFTPKTVQTREERVKLVYAVKVRVTGDPGFELKPGMPADVVLTDAK